MSKLSQANNGLVRTEQRLLGVLVGVRGYLSPHSFTDSLR